SKREPWTSVLTGEQGASPGYDPLEFAIREAHRRGLELHAWCNPFRAATNVKDARSSKHISRTHDEWVRRYGNQLWLDPGEPAAREYVLNEMLDIVRRYSVDGIHIDDYFYPYPVDGAGSFPDEASWKRYGARSELSRSDWRRDNVNRFVEALYRGIKSTRPSAKLGISPFGIWRPGVPPTIEASIDSYDHLFADSKHWLEKGWCDYMSPQLYWSIAPAKQSFPVLLNWWRAQSRAGRPIWPGIATERIGSKRPASEIIRQIEMTRQGTDNPGHIHWNMRALMIDKGGVDQLLRQEVYRDAAAVPGS
ncbi:MAG: family 10 glycosylhydrolase, partial [Chthoniobacteraceae bacterium]